MRSKAGADCRPQGAGKALRTPGSSRWLHHGPGYLPGCLTSSPPTVEVLGRESGSRVSEKVTDETK